MADKKSAGNGMLLEQKIIAKGNAYIDSKTGTIRKTPNNWSVTRKGPHIVGAKPIPSGLCDFFGTSKYVGGRTFVFDAKEVSLKKQFNLKYLSPEQMQHMKEVYEQGGFSFVLAWFYTLDQYWIIPYEFIAPYWKAAEEETGLQHISIKDIQDESSPCVSIDDEQFDIIGKVIRYFKDRDAMPTGEDE